MNVLQFLDFILSGTLFYFDIRFTLNIHQVSCNYRFKSCLQKLQVFKVKKECVDYVNSVPCDKNVSNIYVFYRIIIIFQ